MLPFIAAVFALYMARKSRDNIAASGGTLKGGGLATAARILAWINIVVCLALLVFVAVVVVQLWSSA